MGAEFAIEMHQPIAFSTGLEKTADGVTGYFCNRFFAV